MEMSFLWTAVIAACLVNTTLAAPTAQGEQAKVWELNKQARSGKWSASFKLAKLGKPGVEALIDLLNDKSLGQQTRYMAANALGESGSKDACTALLATLGDPVMNVRRCSASALGFLGDRRAIPLLEKLAKTDPYAFHDPKTGKRLRLVRDAAEDALSRIRTGKPRPRPSIPVVVTTDTAASKTIPWELTVEQALAKAKASSKPVLAIVVPIDDKRWSAGFAGASRITKNLPPHPFGNARSAQIDSGLVKERMLMAIVFSDPEIIAFVRTHFVPVRLRLYTLVFDRGSNRTLEDPLKQLGTNALDTTAPALVFANSDGSLVHACARLGVLSAPFTLAMLRAVVRKLGIEPEPQTAKRRELADAWKLVGAGHWQKAHDVLSSLDPPSGESDVSAEAHYLRAYVSDKLGDGLAPELWKKVTKLDHDGPWGSRARLRLARTGGRLDEWETLATFAFDPLTTSTERRVDRKQLDALFAISIDYLLRKQRSTGEWADPFVDVHPAAGPGSQYDRAVARTGIVIDALMKLGPRVPGRKATIAIAIRRGIDFVGRFADKPKPWMWQLTYALHLQVEILQSKRSAADKKLARVRAQKLVAELAKIQHQGGWSYMPPPRIHTFNTGPVLLLLSELRDLGVDVPDKLGKDAAAFLERWRRKREPREFSYASNIHHKHLGSSSCRTALCELALLRHRKSKKTRRLKAGVELFFGHEAKVRSTTKVFEAYFSPYAMHDAYHHFFGHYYAARSLAHLDKASAKQYANQQIETLLGQVELDGSFVDAQMQGKAYSTAMALLTLTEDLAVLDR